MLRRGLWGIIRLGRIIWVVRMGGGMGILLRIGVVMCKGVVLVDSCVV